MATLSDTSTFAEVSAAYDNNASYAEDASIAKALAFCTACRIRLNRVPKLASHGGAGAETFESDPTSIQAELTKAERWVASRSTTNTPARAFTFNDFGR